MDEKTKTISKWLGTGSIDIFGKPFSGKDTQGSTLAGIFGGVLIGGGDILRHHYDPEKVKQIMAEGGIVPSGFYLDMVLPYLARPEFKGKPIILSAVGRSHGEEPAILQAAEASGHPLKVVVLLKLSDEEVWQRLEVSLQDHDRSARSDDHREVLKNRLKKFQDRTVPVIEFYRGKDVLVEVNGALSREEVTAEILGKLVRFAYR
jgi:adenylate kinase